MRIIKELNEARLNEMVGDCIIVDFNTKQDFLEWVWYCDEESFNEVQNNGLCESDGGLEETWFKNIDGIFEFFDTVYYEGALFTYKDKIYFAPDPTDIDELFSTPLDSAIKKLNRAIVNGNCRTKVDENGYQCICLLPKCADYICGKVEQFVRGLFKEPCNIDFRTINLTMTPKWSGHRGLEFDFHCDLLIDIEGEFVTTTKTDFALNVPLELMKGDVE